MWRRACYDLQHTVRGGDIAPQEWHYATILRDAATPGGLCGGCDTAMPRQRFVLERPWGRALCSTAGDGIGGRWLAPKGRAGSQVWSRFWPCWRD
jgi:hypothetical protein